jgi:aryl-alcohol dehydrogenase-like predicted oxidoreductase
MGGTDWGKVNDDELRRVVSAALDSGVNFFDTAAVYGLGRSEEFLASALGMNRKKVVLATKVGLDWTPPPTGVRAVVRRDSSPEKIIEGINGSLKRLQVDCIPLVYIHWPDPSTPIEATIDALVKCREAGKIRYFGCSNFTSAEFEQACSIHAIAALQAEFSLISRSTVETTLTSCHRSGTDVVVYGALAQGLLTGKFGPDAQFPSDDRRSRLPSFKGELFRNHLALVDRLVQIAEKYACKPSQVALSWVLQRPFVTSVIAGAKSTSQILFNVEAVRLRITDDDSDFLTNRAGLRKD